jgi:hypothetical protein
VMCRVVSCRVVSWPCLAWLVLPWRIVSCRVVSCRVVLRYGMSCRGIVSCRAVSCLLPFVLSVSCLWSWSYVGTSAQLWPAAEAVIKEMERMVHTGNLVLVLLSRFCCLAFGIVLSIVVLRYLVLFCLVLSCLVLYHHVVS